MQSLKKLKINKIYKKHVFVCENKRDASNKKSTTPMIPFNAIKTRFKAGPKLLVNKAPIDLKAPAILTQNFKRYVKKVPLNLCRFYSYLFFL